MYVQGEGSNSFDFAAATRCILKKFGLILFALGV